MDLTLASESRLMQLNELADLRDGAYENTRIYKERTKKWHDSKLRGDKDFKWNAWLRGKFTLSPLDVLQGFSFFLQMGFTLILATLDGLDVGLLGDVIGEDDCDDDG
ncbi:hypothetical protein Tco_0109917 [Tanacetum coccineum]